MKIKPVLLIVATLIIGFVLGMLTSAQIRHQRLKPVRVFFSEERFREGFYNAIQPDEKQKEQIDMVLEKYATMNSQLQAAFRKDLETNMDAFRKEIDAFLTREQIARLKELDERRHDMIRRSRTHSSDSSSFRGRKHYHHHDMPFHQAEDSSLSVGNKQDIVEDNR